MIEKRLQIFISSTYIDLLEERQAAVEVILKKKHIPAGMELFSSGNKSQWETIKKWIDGSDIFMLILGGRYGSIEKVEGRSYVHLEYEYAIEQQKPYFAIVLDDDYVNKKIEKLHKSAIEVENPDKYKKFKAQVLSNISAICTDVKSIQLAMHDSIDELTNENSFVGWIPGNQSTNIVEMIDQLAKLANENTILKQKLSEYESSTANQMSNLPIDKIIEIISAQKVSNKQIKELPQNYQKVIFDNFEDINTKGINFKNICEVILPFIDGVTPIAPNGIFRNLYKFGIISWKLNSNSSLSIPELTKEGRNLLFSLSNENLDLLFQTHTPKPNQVTNPKVIRVQKKIKSLPGKPTQEILISKAFEFIIDDNEWRNDLNVGISLSTFKELFMSIGIEIEPLKYGCAKFVEVLQVLLKGTLLCIYRIQSSEPRVGFRNKIHNSYERLPDLDIREKHSPEFYKSVLTTGNPIYKFPSFGEFLVICNALEKKSILGLTIEEIIIEINKISEIPLQPESITSTIVGLLNAKIFTAEPETGPLIQKTFTLNEDFIDAEKIKEEALTQMSNKIASYIGEPSKKEILIYAMNMK